MGLKYMGLKSREKGKRGEREAARFLSNLLGIALRRGQQFQGSPDSPDVFGLQKYGLYLEVKRDEVTIPKRIYQAIKQATDDSGNDTPFLMARRNREDWVIIIRAQDIREFCKKICEIKS